MSHEHLAEHGNEHGGHKKIAIFIAVLAALLALAETGGKSAQTAALFHNIDATNLWQFFQAKTIRRTTVETAADALQLDIALARDPATKQILEKRVADWRATAARYRSEPETREGSQELAPRAKEAERKRDLYMEKYHHFELGSAAFQIGIVLASVYLITHMIFMLWGAGLVAALGLAFTIIGLFFPSLVHLF